MKPFQSLSPPAPGTHRSWSEVAGLLSRDLAPLWPESFPPAASALWRHIDLGSKRRSSAAAVDQAAQDWERMADSGPWTREFAAHSVVLAYRSREVRTVPLDALAAVAEQAVDMPGEDPLLQQLLAAELPVALAAVRPDDPRAMDWARQAAANLRDALTGLLDDGLPETRDHFDALPAWVGVWTRAGLLLAEIAERDAPLPGHAGYLAALGQILRWGPLLSAAKPWLTRAINFSGEQSLQTAAQAALGAGAARASQTLPEPSYHAGASQRSLLASGWWARTTRLEIDYGQHPPRIELCVGGRPLLTGPLSITAMINGVAAEPAEGWTDMCDFRDDEVAYLELEGALESGARLGLQWMLAHDEQLLILVATLIAAGHDGLPHAERTAIDLALPLAAEIDFEPAEETCEGWLLDPGRRWRAFPLSLPEWRQRAAGDFQRVDGALHLRQAVNRPCLLTAVAFDFSPRRRRQAATWRQLTVGEDLQAVSPDRAAAFRLQVGSRQWVFYRSLAPATPRSFLGVHTVHETYLARFDSGGELHPLLMVDA